MSRHPIRIEDQYGDLITGHAIKGCAYLIMRVQNPDDTSIELTRPDVAVLHEWTGILLESGDI